MKLKLRERGGLEIKHHYEASRNIPKAGGKRRAGRRSNGIQTSKKTKVKQVCDIQKGSRLRTKSLIHPPTTLNVESGEKNTGSYDYSKSGS